MVHSMVPHAKVSTAKQAHGTPAQLGQVRKPAKNEIEKLRETDWSYLKFGVFEKHI